MVWRDQAGTVAIQGVPIMEAPASVRPKAAVATGRVLWICRARSVRSRLLIAAACTSRRM